MKKTLLFLAMLLPIPSAGQGVQRISQATQNVNGFVKVLSGAKIQVCTYPACASVPIYSNASLTLPLSNPFYADANGNYQYFAIPGSYLEKSSTPGTLLKSTLLVLDGGGGGGAIIFVNGTAMSNFGITVNGH